MQYRAALLALFLAIAVEAYPTGPPSCSCLNQQPFHNITAGYAVYAPMPGAATFAINVNSATWTSGGTLSVTLTGISGKRFGGFIIKAVRVSSGYTNMNLGPLLGTFVCTTSVGVSAPVKYHSVYAPSGENNCVSHSMADDGLYQTVVCQWTAPATNEGAIQFVATVVVDYEDYQSQIQSAILPNAAGSPNFTMPNDTMTSKPNVFGCGTAKTCALYPPSCDVRGGCRSGVMMTQLPAGGGLLFQVFGTTFDWLAVGFGDSTEMKDLEIITCAYDPNQKKVVLSAGFAPGQFVIPVYRPDLTMVQTAIDVNSGDSMSLPIQPNTIYCQFVRPVVSSFVYYSYNRSSLSNKPVTVTNSLADQGKYVVLAQGQAIARTANIGKHTHIPLRTPKQFSTSNSATTMYFEGLEGKVKTHATLMTIFWLFLCGFGIIVARHTRPVLTQEVAKKQIWFLLHAAFMVIGYVIAIAGVIYILVKGGKWEKDSEIHGIIGLIGMSLGLLNIIAGIFRPHPGTRFRPVFNRLHRWNGLLAFLFAGVAIWLGATFESHRPEFRFWAVIVLGLWSGLQIIFMVGFECARLRVVKNKKQEAVINKRFQMGSLASAGGNLGAEGSTDPLEKDDAEPKVKGKQLVHITGVWIAVYGMVFLGLAAAFWAGVWIH